MAVATNQHEKQPETTYSTKRVFMRAEHKDRIKITEVVDYLEDRKIPNAIVVIQRVMTYFGPRFRVEANDEQYLLTAPGPEKEAWLWEQTKTGWEKIAEVCLDFDGSPPQYDICLHCDEPLSTVAHRRRAAVGSCKNS